MTTETSLTYRELYAEVLRWHAVLGHYLQDKTIVCLDRSPRLVAVLIALQWLHIPYIPIDRTQPLSRIQMIIDDCQAQAFIFDGFDLPDYSGLTCLQLNLNELEHRATEERVSPYQLKQESLAYIIYTSGSTGKPKGVAISKIALNNFLACMSRYFLGEEQGLLLAITSIAFDIAMLELFLPLWQKRTVFLSNQTQHKDPESLIRILNDYPISHLQATPAMLKLLMPFDWQAQSKLVVLCGGELMTPMLAKSLLPKVSELWNMYGPTEATIWCAFKRIRPGEPITIGRPIDNSALCVMDSSLNILPPYVKGELYISGLCLAQGYVNNVALTNERFIPWKKALGGLLYRVGDMACSTAEGEFIIFGRSDNQIKLHGYRIELEEVEAHIQNLPGVREAVVVVSNEQLIAYLSCNASVFSETDFRNRLAASLPDYMIPSRIIFLDKLPRSVTSKIARNALPPPGLSTSGTAHKDATLTSIQLSLVRIWANELGLFSLNIHDNFFELGGHSITAARIALDISQEFGKKITLNTFYLAPTIAEFAEELAVAPDIDDFPKDIIKTDKKNAWFPLEDFQLTLWVSRFFEPQIKRLNNAARRRFKGHLNKAALELALNLVFRKQDVLSYEINRFYPAQKRRFLKGPFKWREISLQDFDKESSEDYLRQSFNKLCHQRLWGRQSLMTFKLFYLKQDEVELQVSLSHFISDEESPTIFFYELINAYHFYADYNVLNAKSSYTYSTYVREQNALSKQSLGYDADFWAHYFQDADACFFPERYLVKQKKIEENFTTYLQIPESLIKKLQAFCLKHQVSLSDTLSAAVVLSLQSCCEDQGPKRANLFMNNIRSTREDPNYDKVIGCFLCLHSFKVSWSKNKTLLDLSKEIQQAKLETLQYQKAPNFVKFAAMIQNGKRQNYGSACLSFLFSKLAYRINLNLILLKACMILLFGRNKASFMINVNILSSFLSEKPNQRESPLFELHEQIIPEHPYPISVINNVFETCFHKNGKDFFVAITAHLSTSFREYFGKTMLEVVQKALE